MCHRCSTLTSSVHSVEDCASCVLARKFFYTRQQVCAQVQFGRGQSRGARACARDAVVHADASVRGRSARACGSRQHGDTTAFMNADDSGMMSWKIACSSEPCEKATMISSIPQSDFGCVLHTCSEQKRSLQCNSDASTFALHCSREKMQFLFFE